MTELIIKPKVKVIPLLVIISNLFQLFLGWKPEKIDMTHNIQHPFSNPILPPFNLLKILVPIFHKNFFNKERLYFEHKV